MAFDNSFNNFNNGNDAVNYNNGTDIVDANIRQIASGKPSTQNSEKEFKKAKYWLNIGVRTNRKDSQGQPLFIQIGTGIAFDNVQLKNAKGESFTAEIGQLHDEIVLALQDMFQRLGEGKRVIVDALEVQAYKVPEHPVENTKPTNSVSDAVEKIKNLKLEDIPF